jgi:aspartate aminotransferase
MPPLSQRQAGIAVAATMEAAARARALRAAGHDVISLTLGEPDFATPTHAVEAAYQAALRGDTRYPPVAGTPALIEAVAAKFRSENGLGGDARTGRSFTTRSPPCSTRAAKSSCRRLTGTPIR